MTASTPAARSRFRLRLLAACAVLVGVAMAQSPGLLVADTKFDLAVAPAEFLSRASHLWDGEGALGQLQNQAYGYLWPTGPFFVLGAIAELPGWVVQRLWTGLVLCVALTGMARLARAFGVRSDLACLLGGFAYALSPRMLTTLGPISSESWPMALAPWVLLPLVVGAERGSPRRAAALSALAVALVGGVNAAATFAVLPLGIVWLLTRAPGARRRQMMLWWPAFTALGTLWWLVPLFLMGAYSPPFLDFIESASTTTFPTTVFDALRGTSNWVPYLNDNWRAGNELLTSFHIALDHGVLLLLGLAGLLHPRTPHRLFLGISLLVGMAMVTLGHTGAVHGWFAGDLQALLDTVLSPVRNVHKLDPVVRVPLVLGLVLLLDHVLDRARRDREHELRRAAETGAAADATGAVPLHRLSQYVIVGTAVLAVLGSASPVVGGRLTPAHGIQAVPSYWEQAASWLSSRSDETTTLLLPGSSFGTYVWGTPWDEPMQSLAESRWAVRNAIPLTPAGNIRMLDSIERRIAQGKPSAGLAPTLRRAGVTHLLVRNDLARSPDVPDPVLVHQALAGSPGISPATSFGPVVGGEAHLDGVDGQRVLVNGGWQSQYAAVEIYAVGRPGERAVGADSLPVVVGGPEDLLDLSELGVLGDEPTVLADDLEGSPGEETPLILTDGLRRVERSFGRVHDATSATLSPDDPTRIDKPVRDYHDEGADRWLTDARVTGVRSLTASSSMADANVLGTPEPGRHPYAAADGDPVTAWTAGYDPEQAAWWEVRLAEVRPIDTVTVVAGGSDETVRVQTGDVTTVPVRVAAHQRVSIPVGDRPTDRVRVVDASGRAGNRLTLAEVVVPGMEVDRVLVLPRLPERWRNPDFVVLRAVSDARTGCAEVDLSVRCVAAKAVSGEEPAGFNRVVRLPTDGRYRAALEVRARPGHALVRTLLQNQPVGVSTSTTGVADVRASALAAVDRSTGTAWIADTADPRPSISLNWLGWRTVRHLDLEVADDTAARSPRLLTVEWFGGSFQVEVDEGGRARFPQPITTDGITIRVDEAEPVSSLGFDGIGSLVPVGISELRVAGVPEASVTLSDRPVRHPCGTGPTLMVNGAPRATSVVASPTELYAGGEVEARICGGSAVQLTAGANRVDVEPSAAFVPTSLVLDDGSAPQPSTVAVGLAADGPVTRVLEPADRAGAVVMRTNENPGWQATQDGARLEPLIVDGWQQGWRLPSSSPGTDEVGPVAVTFAPDRTYRVGLGAGAAAALLLFGIFWVPRRRWPGADAVSLPERRLPQPVVAAIAMVAAGVLGGWPGVLVGAAGFGAARWLARRSPAVAPWVLSAVVLPASLGYVMRPWGDPSGWAGDWAWPSYLALFACVGVLGGLAGSRELLPDPPPRRPRLFRRIAGSSTRR